MVSFAPVLKVTNKILWFGLACGSIIAGMADLQLFYMDQ